MVSGIFLSIIELQCVWLREVCIRHILNKFTCWVFADMIISCNFCRRLKTTDTNPVGFLCVMVPLCWSYRVTAKDRADRLYCTTAVEDTTHGDLMKTPLFTHERVLDPWSGVGQRPGLVESAGAPVSSLIPTSGPCCAFGPGSDAHGQELLFSLLLHPSWQAAILYTEICLFAAWVCLHRLQSAAEDGEATSEACERCFTTTCWRMGFSTSDSARRSPAPLSKHVRAQGLEAKLIVHKLIQPPWFCLFKWDSKTLGCLLRKSQKCQISFFFFFLLFRLSFLLFTRSPSALWAKNPW